MIVAIMGKSASGKNEVCKCLETACSSTMVFFDCPTKVKPFVSYTTRAPREGEVDGVDYHFISTERFLAMERAGKFVECVQYGSNHYGTAKEDVIEAANSRHVYTAVVTPEGAEQFKSIVSEDDILTVYVDAPDSIRAKRYIDREGAAFSAKSLEIFARRMAEDSKVFAGIENEADVVIDNSSNNGTGLFSDLYEKVEREVLGRILDRLVEKDFDEYADFFKIEK